MFVQERASCFLAGTRMPLRTLLRILMLRSNFSKGGAFGLIRTFIKEVLGFFVDAIMRVREG